MVKKNDIRRRVEKLTAEVEALRMDTRCRKCHYPERRGRGSLVLLGLDGIDPPATTCSKCGRETDPDGETLTLLEVDGEIRTASVVRIVLELTRPDGTRPEIRTSGRQSRTPGVGALLGGPAPFDPAREAGLRQRAEAEARVLLAALPEAAIAEALPLLVRGIVSKLRAEV